MPAKKKPVIPAAELKAERERIAVRAQVRFNMKTVLTLASIATQQAETVILLREISFQLKKTNKTLAAILSASVPDEAGGVH